MSKEWALSPEKFFDQLRKKFVDLFVAWIAFVSFCVVFSKIFVSPTYEYTLLIRSANNQGIEPSSSNALGGSLFRPTNTNSLLSKAVKFIDYAFITNPKYTENSDVKTYVKSVELIQETDLLEIKVRAPSIESAKDYSDKVFRALISNFKNEILPIKIETDLRISELINDKNKLAEFDREINKLKNEIGYNSILADNKSQLIEIDQKLRDNIFRLKSMLASGKIQNFEKVYSKPTSYKPISPKTLVVVMISGLLSIFIILGYLIYKSIILIDTNDHLNSNIVHKKIA